MFKNSSALFKIIQIPRENYGRFLTTNSHKFQNVQNLAPAQHQINVHPVPNPIYFLDLSSAKLDLKTSKNSNFLIEPLEKIGGEVESLYGSSKFSMKNSLSFVFGNFGEIITLFTLKNSRVDHPLLHLAHIIEGEGAYKRGSDKNPYPLWRSLLVFLATDMVGFSKEILKSSPEIIAQAHDRHSRMNKIVEITYITQQIHKRVVDIDEGDKKLNSVELHKANKASTLIGDLLWTQKCIHMAALKCQPVTALICGFLMDYCESEFMFNVNSTSPFNFSQRSWVTKTQLGLGSLIGNSLSASLLFSGQDENIRKNGFNLGSLIGLTYQAYEDLSYFNKDSLGSPNWIDVGLLPIVYKIQKEPNVYSMSPNEIFERVKGDEEVMREGRETFFKLQQKTLECIESFPNISNTGSQKLLQRFIQSLVVTK